MLLHTRKKSKELQSASKHAKPPKVTDFAKRISCVI